MGLLIDDRVQPPTLIIHTIMDPLNKFVEEDSKVEGEFSIIINGESDSGSSLDEETPSDLDPSNLGPSDSSASKEGSTRPPSVTAQSIVEQ
jgi:hypothetical protein